MTARTASVAIALVLAVACSKRNADRDSRIGRSDAAEDMEPASRVVEPRDDFGRGVTIEGESAGGAEEDSESAAEAEPTAAATAADPEPESATESPSQNRTPDVVYVPTPQPVVDKMLELAQVTKDDLVYDLGCGDGRIVVTAAKRYKARAIGFDIDPQRVSEARENVRKNNVEHLVTIEQRDIFTLDLTPATVVTLYLLPELNDKLRPQLERMAPGTRIVSHDFDFTGVSPATHVEMLPARADRKHEVFFYTLPFKTKAPLPRPVVGPAPSPP